MFDPQKYNITFEEVGWMVDDQIALSRYGYGHNYVIHNPQTIKYGNTPSLSPYKSYPQLFPGSLRGLHRAVT